MLLLPLPITPTQLLVHVVRPAWLALPAKMRGAKAEAMAIAIALQETGLAARRQKGDGPARGLTQFERGGGVRECIRNPAVSTQTELLCERENIPFSESPLWAALEFNDELAMSLTRLNLWRSPMQLPELGDSERGWTVYKAIWAPGAPRPEHWPDNYARALAAVQETP